MIGRKQATMRWEEDLMRRLDIMGRRWATPRQAQELVKRLEIMGRIRAMPRWAEDPVRFWVRQRGQACHDGMGGIQKISWERGRIQKRGRQSQKIILNRQVHNNKVQRLRLQQSLNYVGIPPPDDSVIINIPQDSYTHTHSHCLCIGNYRKCGIYVGLIVTICSYFFYGRGDRFDILRGRVTWKIKCVFDFLNLQNTIGVHFFICLIQKHYSLW